MASILDLEAGPAKLDKPAPGALDESPGGAKVRAARRLRMALAAKDDGGVAAAFKEMYKICAAEHGGGAEDDEEPAYGEE